MSCTATQTLDASIETARHLLADLEEAIVKRLADLTTLEAAIQAMQRHLARYHEGASRERHNQAS